MNELLQNQIAILIIFFITGACIGLLFDVFRIQRRVIKTFNFITYIQDILFWIISGLLLIFVIMKYTNGEVRMYMIFSIIIGMLMYFVIISKYVMKIFVSIFTFILNVLKKLFSPVKYGLRKFTSFVNSFSKKNNKVKK